MDLSNLKGLLDSNNGNSPEVSDNDLEDELNAILSGQTAGRKPRQMASSSAVKRNKQNDAKQSKSGKTSKINNQMSENEFMLPQNVLDINKLGVFDDLNDEGDHEDIDEDDPDLLSEISAIASSKSTASWAKNSHHFMTPEVDYLTNDEPNTETVKTVPQMKVSSSVVTVVDDRVKTSLDKDVRRPLIETRLQPKPKPAMAQTLVANEDKKPSNSDSNTQKKESSLGSTSMDTKVTEDKREIPKLVALRDDYKRAALNCKKSGQQTTALSHIKTAKQIEVLIKALEDGLSVDLSQLPPFPSLSIIPSDSSEKPTPSEAPPAVDMESENIEMTTEDVKKFFNAPPPPNTVMEALEQRLNKFKSTQEQANNENNSSKARRLGRIVKQYETAIKDFKKGKTLNFDELPTPPGFGPIPVANPTPNLPPPKPNLPNSGSDSAKPILKPSENSKTNSPQNVRPIPSQPTQTPPKSDQKPALKRASSTANKQLNYLLERQRLFKEAALESKQKGDIQQAKEYLRMAKGFEPLIEATQNGLPIDATSIPTPPQMNEDFVVVSHPESAEGDDMEREEMFRKIEVELQNQIEMCKRNKEYFLHLGDISTASKFEKYAIDSRKDLDLLQIRWKNGQKVPNVKYETRTFSVVVCNTEVGTNEVSVEVVKAIDIPAKNDVDTYIKLEFPFPNVSDKTVTCLSARHLTGIFGNKQDRNQTARTKTVKNNINPVFNETFKFDIDRKSRTLPRVFKRHPLKLELMSKGGLFRSDSLIGTALIKLVDFETKCTIHESINLTEGRKVVGGRIEVKVKIREPLLAKQVEEVKEKWLSFV